jgi:hypothetical protein
VFVPLPNVPLNDTFLGHAEPSSKLVTIAEENKLPFFYMSIVGME